MAVRVLGLLMLILCCGVLAPRAAKASPIRPVGETSGQNEATVLRSIKPILEARGYVGRLYYRGSCSGTDALGLIAFPEINTGSAGAAHGLRAVRRVFLRDGNVSVSSEAGKIITIRIGQPSEEILQTRISTFALSALQRFNPGLIVGAVWQVQEIRAKRKNMKLAVPIMFMDMLLTQPARGLPHLPRVLKGVTVSGVFDLVAKTFNGIVVYGICRRPNGTGIVDASFIGLDNRDPSSK